MNNEERAIQTEPLLTEKQSTLILGTTASTLKQSRHTGMLYGKPSPAFVKMSRSVRYKLSALLEFRDQFPVYQNTSEITESVRPTDQTGVGHE